MNPADEEFLRSLRATFRTEAAEHLQTMASNLLEMEKAPPPETRRHLVASVFRSAHSLKGAARAVDFPGVESLCQALEDRFAAWKRDDAPPAPADFDSLHGSLNAISAALAGVGSAVLAAAATPGAEAPEPAAGGSGTVRISVEKLDSSLARAEEMLAAKLSAGQRAEDLRELAGRFSLWRNEWSARESEARALRRALSSAGTDLAAAGTRRMLDFLDWNADQIKSLEERASGLAHAAEQDGHAVGKLVDELVEDSKKMLLLPISALTASFPKLVRDLSRDQGKEAELVVHGEHLEVDKRVLEEMKAPLIHLLRNCVDHGIEAPEVRVRAGKSRRGTIALTASALGGGRIEFAVSDDGAGINAARVREAAVRRGAVSAEEADRIDEAQMRDLIFRPDVTTTQTVTRVSGRGLGLAIVREKAEEMGGSAVVASEPGRSTTFRIVLPATLVTFRGILVEAGGRPFVVPTVQVERAVQVAPGDIRTVEGRETAVLGDRPVAWVRLADILGLPSALADGRRPALVLASGGQRAAFGVDAIVGEQEVLVKKLGRPLSRVRHIAGATVLGSGAVAPILNASDLLRSARQGGARPSSSPKAPSSRTKSILVAEDSITSRTLLKGILETDGYKVATAVDGMEAFALLRTEKFDLLVSDVEMPRLGGFDLTARVRADPKLTGLPVILVTALDKREDRERGIDVGASAYIVKSLFDQADLLEAVRRLA